jgi:hypothetical protein
MRTTAVGFLGVFAATLLACSEYPAPTGFDSDPLGRWALVAVDGHALPAPVDAGAEIVGGELELSADGSYWSSTRATIAGVAFQDVLRGRWSVVRDRITLERADQTAVVAGTWNGVTIEIAGTRTLRYTRPPMTATTNPTTASPTPPKRAPRW